MAVGCCGSRVSLSAFLAEADAYPANSPRGARARAGLAYGIAAGQAARAGNRVAYERAMRGLQGLGQMTAPTVADAQATQVSLQSVLNSVSSQAGGALSAARPYVNAVAGLASLGTTIASQVPGADQNAIAIINMVIGWVRALINGTAITVPTLDVNTLNSFAQFCVWRDTIKNGITGIIGTAMGFAANDQNAQQVLTTVQGILTGVIDSICNISQIANLTQNIRAAGNCAYGGAIGPHWVVTWTSADGSQISCGCEPGFVAMPDHTCQPATTTPGGGTAVRLPGGFVPLGPAAVRTIAPALTTRIPQCPPNTTLRNGACISSGGAQQGGGASAAVVAIPAALALWWLFL